MQRNSRSFRWNLKRNSYITVEPPNKEHFGDTASVLISEVVLFRRVNNVLILWLKGPGGVSFVGRLSLSWRVLVPLYSYKTDYLTHIQQCECALM